MGSSSSKDPVGILGTKADRKRHANTSKQSTYDSSETENVPAVLVSLIRDRAVLVTEGRSVATQTDDNDWRSLFAPDKSNGAVVYDIEAVDAGHWGNDGKAYSEVTERIIRREQSDIGTNTTVTAVDSKPVVNRDHPEEFSDIPKQEKIASNTVETLRTRALHNTEQSQENAVDNITLERYGKYKVKVEKDKEKCAISAVAFLESGDLVLIDRSNHKIKFVDADFRYISAQDLPAKPWAVCARGVDVYVTIGNTRILHLYVKDMLIEPERSFEVKGRCLGMCMYGEYIAVGLQIGQVHLLDTMGERHGTIRLPILDDGKPCNPWHLYVSGEGNLLVTDSDAGVVFGLNKESQIVLAFREVSSPRGTTVDSRGNILIVGRDNESGVVVKILPRDWELRGMLHMQQQEMAGSRSLLKWAELEFVPYCADYRDDDTVVLGGIRDSLKIMKLSVAGK